MQIYIRQSSVILTFTFLLNVDHAFKKKIEKRAKKKENNNII